MSERETYQDKLTAAMLAAHPEWGECLKIVGPEALKNVLGIVAGVVRSGDPSVRPFQDPFLIHEQEETAEALP